MPLPFWQPRYKIVNGGRQGNRTLTAFTRTLLAGAHCKPISNYLPYYKTNATRNIRNNAVEVPTINPSVAASLELSLLISILFLF